MNDPETNHTIFMSAPAGLARMLALDQPETVLWGAEEMRSMWRHQLRAPTEADLSTVQSSNASALRSAPEARAFHEKSFNELLLHVKPPLALLKLTKDFAKQTIQETEDPHLKQIAAALYYASYAAGMTRCGTRVGGMSDHELRGGFDWTLSQIWVDPETKALIGDARRLL